MIFVAIFFGREGVLANNCSNAAISGCVPELNRVPVVLPITTGDNFARRRGFEVSLEDTGTRTGGVIRCDQPRAHDFAALNTRRLEFVPEPVMDEVLARPAAILA